MMRAQQCEDRNDFERSLVGNWQLICRGLGLSPDTPEWEAAVRMTETCFQRGESMTREEGELLREFFRQRAKRAM